MQHCMFLESKNAMSAFPSDGASIVITVQQLRRLLIARCLVVVQKSIEMHNKLTHRLNALAVDCKRGTKSNDNNP